MKMSQVFLRYQRKLNHNYSWSCIKRSPSITLPVVKDQKIASLNSRSPFTRSHWAVSIALTCIKRSLSINGIHSNVISNSLPGDARNSVIVFTNQRDVDNIFNWRELSVHRRVYKNPLSQIFKTGEGFSGGKIELITGYFPRLRLLSTPLIII